MPLETSHRESMERLLYDTLHSLKRRYTVRQLAEMAGCSVSQFYLYVPDSYAGAKEIKSSELTALRYTLAEKYEDYTLTMLDLPAHVQLKATSEVAANGSTLDETLMAAEAVGELAAQQRGADPDVIESVARRLEETAQRLFKEAALARGRIYQSEAQGDGGISILAPTRKAL